jgi:polyisoprenoid-binding protein YceI
MKRNLLLLLVLCAIDGQAQKFGTRNGFTGFYSKTPLENIKAENKQTYAVIDAGSKTLGFTLLVKGFSFPKQLMQDHFNENYIESDKYPKAGFTGNYSGEVDVTKNGVYPVQVKGNLTLHGITKPVEMPATIEVQDGKLTGKAAFKVKASDFGIQIPSLVREKIAQQIDVIINAECAALK